MSDPRVAAIPAADCGEPLTDVRGTLLVDDRRADATGSYAHGTGATATDTGP
ncbi:hypothetical protein [Streptomyces olivaceoviridis]|uniref:hypothetical protein n=1 Tax=Streptomyces olivaceoviridis TaxID=1921 RepID=UPI003F4C7EA5